MSRLEAVQAALVAATPSTKAMGWILATGVTVFWAGVGSALSFGEYANLPEASRQHGEAIDSLRVAVRNGDSEREKILCLVTLTATGEVLNPLEVTERCP